MITIDVISGFLGAGKTTFINRFCKVLQNFGETAVIIENEYGDESIDGKLLSGTSNAVFDLSQGCICCTLKNELEDTLLQIAEQLKPDRVLLEPSGVFLLSEIFHIFKNPEIARQYELSSLITLVDAPLFLKFKGKYGIYLENQIKYSTQVVLTKQRDLSKEQIDQITMEIKTIKPDANICLDSMFDLDDGQIMELTQNNPVVYPDESIKPKHAAFKSVTLYPKKLYEAKELEAIMNDLKNGAYGDIYRLKGFVKNKTGAARYHLQYVGGNHTVALTPKQFKPMVVVIGEQINKAELTKIFE